MLITVAEATGQDAIVLAERPFWQVLYQFYHLREQEARRVVTRRLERVDSGFLAAYAFNEPARLDDEMRSVHEALAALDRPARDDTAALATLRERGEAFIARLEAGRVLSPEALIS